MGGAVKWASSTTDWLINSTDSFEATCSEDCKADGGIVVRIMAPLLKLRWCGGMAVCSVVCGCLWCVVAFGVVV